MSTRSHFEHFPKADKWACEAPHFQWSICNKGISGFLSCLIKETEWKQTEPHLKPHYYFFHACIKVIYRHSVCLNRWQINSSLLNDIQSTFSVLGGLKEPLIYNRWWVWITWHTANSTCWKVDFITKVLTLLSQTAVTRGNARHAQAQILDDWSQPHVYNLCLIFTDSTDCFVSVW